MERLGANVSSELCCDVQRQVLGPSWSEKYKSRTEKTEPTDWKKALRDVTSVATDGLQMQIWAEASSNYAERVNM